MDVVGRHHVKEVSRIRNTKASCFLSYIKDRYKDKYVLKNKHDNIQTQW
jgi:hypothetical protein